MMYVPGSQKPRAGAGNLGRKIGVVADNEQSRRSLMFKKTSRRASTGSNLFEVEAVVNPFKDTVVEEVEELDAAQPSPEEMEAMEQKYAKNLELFNQKVYRPMEQVPDHDEEEPIKPERVELSRSFGPADIDVNSISSYSVPTDDDDSSVIRREMKKIEKNYKQTLQTFYEQVLKPMEPIVDPEIEEERPEQREKIDVLSMMTFEVKPWLPDGESGKEDKKLRRLIKRSQSLRLGDEADDIESFLEDKKKPSRKTVKRSTSMRAGQLADDHSSGGIQKSPRKPKDRTNSLNGVLPDRKGKPPVFYDPVLSEEPIVPTRKKLVRSKSATAATVFDDADVAPEKAPRKQKQNRKLGVLPDHKEKPPVFYDPVLSDEPIVPTRKKLARSKSSTAATKFDGAHVVPAKAPRNLKQNRKQSLNLRAMADELAASHDDSSSRSKLAKQKSRRRSMTDGVSSDEGDTSRVTLKRLEKQKSGRNSINEGAAAEDGLTDTTSKKRLTKELKRSKSLRVGTGNPSADELSKKESRRPSKSKSSRLITKEEQDS